MTWKEAKKTLSSEDIARNSDGILQNLPPVTPRMDIVDNVDMFFTNKTEMDAAVRVVQFLLVVCKDIYDSTQQRVKIQCQPKFREHPIFTDFLICKTDDTPKLIIEVKRSTIYTSLHFKSKEAAQMFKEVHIVMEKTSTLPFC